MYSKKNNKIETKVETKDYEKRYRFYATPNPEDSNIINLDIFYKHTPENKGKVMQLEMFNHFYKPFATIDWNNTKNIEWLEEVKYDIDFLKERGENDYHYRYYVDRKTYSIIKVLIQIGFVPVVWKLPKYVADVISLQKTEQNEKVKKDLSYCRYKMPMLYLAFTPLYIDENTLRHNGLAQISRYIMLHDLVYAVKSSGFTDLRQICQYLRNRQDVNKKRQSEGKNMLVLDHHTKIENNYNSGYTKRFYPYQKVDNIRHLYNYITAVWYIENLGMPSANNLINNIYEIDSNINCKVKNNIIDRNTYMYSYITDFKTQILTVYLQNYFVIPQTKDLTNVIEIILPLSSNVGESYSKNIESLYNELEEAKKQNKTEGEFLYCYAQKNGLDLRYRPCSKYKKDEYFLLWLNKVPLLAVADDIENIITIKNI